MIKHEHIYFDAISIQKRAPSKNWSLIFRVLKFVFLITFSLIMKGCTLSFQNISTHGTAEDLVDETQDTTPKVSTSVSAPISAIPK